MNVEAASWDDRSVGHRPPLVNDEEKWHVQIAAGEVKVVTLEQLDDLFRLSLVDSETHVWQTGMTEWQPLRVIAGLDDEPAPAPTPKRAPPKPPTRTAVMSTVPSPTRTVAMAPAPQPLPRSVRPAPHSVAPSVRPAPPAPRPMTPAPASFYPEPIQARSSVYPPTVASAAPAAFSAPAPVMNSVRPLVVSQAPMPSARGGSGFGRVLVAVALLAGVSVTAYRNDVLRDAAHQAHQDALYARLESALGGPAFGTLRALEQSAAAQPVAEPTSVDAPARTAMSAPEVSSTPAPANGSASPPVVSIESLAPEQKARAAKASAAAAPSEAAQPAPAHGAASPVQPKAALSHAPGSEKPTSTKAFATKAPVEKSEPVATKPRSDLSERERLNAAIGQSMTESASSKAKSKKAKSKGNEYDPLNPNL